MTKQFTKEEEKVFTDLRSAFRWRYLLIVVILIVMTYSTDVMACKCVVSTAEETPDNLKKAHSVFLGRVTNVNKLDSRIADFGADLGIYTEYKVDFDVKSVWKGVNNKTISINTEIGPCCMCIGYHFEKNKYYLVFANEKLRVESSCDPTRDIGSEKDFLAEDLEIIKALGTPIKIFE